MRLKSLGTPYTRFKALSPGDKLIAGALAALLFVLLIMGVYMLERQFLIEVPSRGGSLVEGSVGAPRFVNPLLALSDADRDLTALTYAGLMGYDEHGHLVPVLAESYELSEDGKTYTFRLKADAEFSDGTPVTAEDVVFTIMKAQDPGLKSPRLAAFAGIRAAAVDARTVSFELPEAYAPFLEEAVLGILPSHLWKEVSNEEFPFSPYMTEPVGAGPFMTSRIVRDKSGVITRYELRRFDGYALSRPYLSHTTFVYFKDKEALAEALSRGRVEAAYGIPSENAIRIPYSRIFGAFFNQSKDPALARLEVREALSVAIDRRKLVEDVLAGYAVPAYGPVPPSLIGAEGFVPEESGIEDAAAILEAGGWEYDTEERLWKREDEELSLTLTTANVPELRAAAEALRDDWQKLGVPVEIELHNPQDLVLLAIRPRQYEALLYGMVVGRDKDFFAFWDSSQRTDPGLNVSMYANRAVDELLEEMRAEDDPAELGRMLEEFNETVAAEYPAAFTHAPQFVYSVPRGLKGVAVADASAPSDRFASAAFWYRHTEHVWPFLVGGR